MAGALMMPRAAEVIFGISKPNYQSKPASATAAPSPCVRDCAAASAICSFCLSVLSGRRRSSRR